MSWINYVREWGWRRIIIYIIYLVSEDVSVTVLPTYTVQSLIADNYRCLNLQQAAHIRPHTQSGSMGYRPPLCRIGGLFQLKGLDHWCVTSSIFCSNKGFCSNKYSIARSDRSAQQLPLCLMPVPTVLCKSMDLIWILNVSQMNVSQFWGCRVKLQCNNVVLRMLLFQNWMLRSPVVQINTISMKKKD